MKLVVTKHNIFVTNGVKVIDGEVSVRAAHGIGTWEPLEKGAQIVSLKTSEKKIREIQNNIPEPKKAALGVAAAAAIGARGVLRGGHRNPLHRFGK